MLKNIIAFMKSHKKSSIAIIVVLAAGIGYYIYQASTASKTVTKYVLAQAATSTVIATISGSGQVSSSNSVDLTAKASGEVLSVSVKQGDTVKKGQVIAKLDATEAAKTVRDAQISLESAQLSLTKAERGTREEEQVSTKLSLEDAKTSLAKAQTTAETDLADRYDDTKDIILDAYNTVDEALNQKLKDIYSDNTANAKLQVVTLNSQAESKASTLRLDAIESLTTLKSIINNYPATQDGIDEALADSVDAMTILQQYFISLNELMSSAVPSGSVSDSDISTYKSTVVSLANTMNSTLSSLTTQKKAIAEQKTTNADNISSAESSLAKAQNTYDLMVAGEDPLDLASLRLSVQQKKNSLADAQSEYADYTITAPFDGQIASVDIKVGDDLSSGGAVATIISPNKVAEITLSESDIANVKAGQKATLTFDALEDLEITGQVANVDVEGTVSSGVVSYAVTVNLDTDDESIKSGMTVTATIITETKVDVLAVPNAAVKSKSGVYYVLTLPSADASAAGSSDGVTSDVEPTQVYVTTGLSDDTNTEIISGLAAGDIVVTKTTTVTASADSSSAPSLLQSLMPGNNRNSSSKSSSSSSSGSSSKSSSGSSASSGAMPSGDMGGGAPPGM